MGREIILSSLVPFRYDRLEIGCQISDSGHSALFGQEDQRLTGSQNWLTTGGLRNMERLFKLFELKPDLGQSTLDQIDLAKQGLGLGGGETSERPVVTGDGDTAEGCDTKLRLGD